MATYYTVVDYIRCSTSIQNKIDRINQIIEMLEDSILDGELKGQYSQYSLNDGQTTISTVFTSVKSIEDAITALERRKQRLINRCVGYRYGLQDGKTLI